jgi:hypothetical protein
MEAAALASPGRVDTDYYKPGNAQIVEANYGQYKDREAARAAQASQPVNYPGMNTVNMTNAARSGGGGDEYDQLIADQTRKVGYLAGGGKGWLGLFQSGGAQRQLNLLRGMQLERGKLGVDKARLGFDMSKYWQGEHPLLQEKLGIEGRLADVQGRHQQAEERRYAPEIWALNRINALRQEGRDEEADQMERSHRGKSDEKQFVPGVMGGTLVTAPGTSRQTMQYFSGMPPDWKPK